MLDLNKQYKTKNGKSVVKMYIIPEVKETPILAVFGDEDIGWYDENGKFIICEDCEYDLEEIISYKNLVAGDIIKVNETVVCTVVKGQNVDDDCTFFNNKGDKLAILRTDFMRLSWSLIPDVENNRYTLIGQSIKRC